MQLRRLAATVAVAIAASSLAACGGDHTTSQAATEGVYVTTGNLKYQVQISRELNPYDFEDRDYLLGLPRGNTLPPDQAYFAVFLRVFNTSKQPHPAAQRFLIEDTTGKTFQPVVVNPDVNPVAYRPLVVGPGDQLPLPGTLAGQNATQGAMVLFKIPDASFADRPLVLHIAPPTGGREATVDLDV